jgi:hypothetical protein
MGSVSLLAGCQQKVGFFPLLQWLVQARSWIRTRGSLSRAGGYVGSPSSWEQWICSNMLATVRKVATYVDYPQEAYMGHMGTGAGNVRVMLIMFSPARCTSI